MLTGYDDINIFQITEAVAHPGVFLATAWNCAVVDLFPEVALFNTQGEHLPVSGILDLDYLDHLEI